MLLSYQAGTDMCCCPIRLGLYCLTCVVVLAGWDCIVLCCPCGLGFDMLCCPCRLASDMLCCPCRLGFDMCRPCGLGFDMVCCPCRLGSGLHARVERLPDDYRLGWIAACSLWDHAEGARACVNHVYLICVYTNDTSNTWYRCTQLSLDLAKVGTLTSFYS